MQEMIREGVMVELELYVDRIEDGQYAVIELPDLTHVVMDRKFLPPAVTDGSLLKVTIEIKEEK